MKFLNNFVLDYDYMKTIKIRSPDIMERMEDRDLLMELPGLVRDSR